MTRLNREESLSNRQARGRPRIADSASASLVDILNLVRMGRATTRNEIEKVGEFGRAVVADRLASLAELGLVNETELATATGGRAPKLVRFSEDRGRIVAATLDQNALGVAIADLSGRLLIEHHEPADLAGPAPAIVDRLCDLFDWILTRQNTPALAPWAISLSLPAHISKDPQRDFVTETPRGLPGWEGIPLVETLVGRFGAPVWLRSSTETMTMGELYAGAGSGFSAMLFVEVAKRITVGLVLDGRLYRGATGATGLIGEVPVQSGHRSATLDSLAGLDAIVHEGRIAADSGRSLVLAELQRRQGRLTVSEINQAAQMSDPIAIEILAQSGGLIGQVVATLANALNPEIIVLSGPVAQSNDILLAAVRRAVYGASHPLVTRDIKIVGSQMSSSAGLVGACRIAIESLFSPVFLKDWILGGKPILHPHSAQLQHQSELQSGDSV